MTECEVPIAWWVGIEGPLVDAEGILYAEIDHAKIAHR
jgi:hypothetical protein